MFPSLRRFLAYCYDDVLFPNPSWLHASQSAGALHGSLLLINAIVASEDTPAGSEILGDLSLLICCDDSNASIGWL